MELPFLPQRLVACIAVLGLAANAAAQPVVTVAPVIPATPAIISRAPYTDIRDAGWDPARSNVDTSRPRTTHHPARLTNLSVRGTTSPDHTLIAGAVVQGTAPLPLLIRAIGPGLAPLGVAAPLSGPRLEIFQSASLAATTNTLGAQVPAVSAYVGAFPARGLSSPPIAGGSPLNTGDAGLVGPAAPGAIAAHCSSEVGASGVALLEFYDVEPAPSATSPRLINLSSRARVESGAGTLILGFTIGGEGSVRLLLRGVGPTLQRFNVTGTLADPTIELFAGNASLATNDNWTAGVSTATAVQAAARAVGAFDLVSANDAALVVTLPAGTYSLHVRGAASQSGAALAEIYEVPAGVALDLPAMPFNFAESTNAIGLDLFRDVGATKAGENFILSPYSIESALALAYAGADGDTRTEMARVLRLPADDPTLQQGFVGLRRALDKMVENSQRIIAARTVLAGTRLDPIEWGAANRLFGQRDFAFRAPFLALMNEGFEAPLQLLDFRADPEVARATINGWVEEQTRQRIRNLISEPLQRSTRLVLVNALYLKAPWDTPFEKTRTVPRPFRSPTDGPRDVPTMHRTDFLGYAAEEGLTVVTLDYLGGELQCVIILPAEGQSVDAAAARLTPAHFARWSKLREGSRRYVALALPKFKFESPSVNLSNALIALGMRQAFDRPQGSANFDRISPRTPNEYLAITDVYHQTFVALDEEGTEAAAATAVVMATTSSASVPPPAIDVRVDRPFLFALQHGASGACLFLGRITDPR